MLKPTPQYVRYRDEAAVRVGGEPLREERSLYESDGVPRCEGMPVVDQHDEWRRAFGRVEKVWADAPAKSILDLGGCLLADNLRKEEEKYAAPDRPYGKAGKLF